MKIVPKFQFNETNSFFVFVGFVSGVLFGIAGYSLLSCFLSGVFIYVFLRFCSFVWSIIMRLLGKVGGGSGV